MDYTSILNKITEQVLNDIKDQHSYFSGFNPCKCSTCKEPEKKEPEKKEVHWIDSFKESKYSYILLKMDKAYFFQSTENNFRLSNVVSNSLNTLILIDSKSVLSILINDDLEYIPYSFLPSIQLVSTDFVCIGLTKDQGQAIIRKIKEDIKANEE